MIPWACGSAVTRQKQCYGLAHEKKEHNDNNILCQHARVLYTASTGLEPFNVEVQHVLHSVRRHAIHSDLVPVR